MSAGLQLNTYQESGEEFGPLIRQQLVSGILRNKVLPTLRGKIFHTHLPTGRLFFY